MNCEELQVRAAERRLRRSPVDAPADEIAHAAGCKACTDHLRFVEMLAAALDDLPVPMLRPDVVRSATRRAQRVVRAQRHSPELGRPLWVALSLSLLALPIVALHAYLVTQGANAFLAPWLPGPLLAWIGTAYFGSLALTLGGLYGSIPLAVALGRRLPAEPV